MLSETTMTGVFIVLISVAVICWLIVKKFYPAWSLFVVGIVTIAIVAAISGDPVATGKKATALSVSIFWEFSVAFCNPAPAALA